MKQYQQQKCVFAAAFAFGMLWSTAEASAMQFISENRWIKLPRWLPRTFWCFFTFELLFSWNEISTQNLKLVRKWLPTTTFTWNRSKPENLRTSLVRAAWHFSPSDQFDPSWQLLVALGYKKITFECMQIRKSISFRCQVHQSTVLSHLKCAVNASSLLQLPSTSWQFIKMCAASHCGVQVKDHKHTSTWLFFFFFHIPFKRRIDENSICSNFYWQKLTVFVVVKNLNSFRLVEHLTIELNVLLHVKTILISALEWREWDRVVSILFPFVHFHHSVSLSLSSLSSSTSICESLRPTYSVFKAILFRLKCWTN